MTDQVIIITGPTASGKTHLSELVAQRIGGEIINADMGQFYVPLTIGTAKPDWQNAPVKSHLFDIINTPTELNVAEYRRLVFECAHQIIQRKHVPIIVGGSFFYIKSLFFPMSESIENIVTDGISREIDFSASSQNLWDLLNAIDPERAKVIHQNDRYRVERALKIWQQTGQKPSMFQPKYDPLFSAFIISLEPHREELLARINQRTDLMIKHDGWIDEAERIINTPWVQFVLQKGFIGYAQLFDWIRQGKPQNKLNTVIEMITILTRQYARRQSIFWKKLKQDLLTHQTPKAPLEILTLQGFQSENLDSLIISIKKSLGCI
jgi:tRNA dimethylallyltransferase